ncbi:ribosome quality control complex subunit 2-like [Cynoglossus semilaevis]|uniref:ribosome quality control complex subunit 2-like n=1 Tax=Cynoglossus semilaevis TaxID=244447 RepID=UPI000D62BA37|nr:ribosome quality control complex subunit 2-like [Cynoglossus semilaevis]
MRKRKTQEEEEEEEEEEEKSTEGADEDDEAKDGVEDSAEESVEDGAVQESTEEGPVDEPLDSETLAKNRRVREKDIHMFTVLTVHRVLSKTGTLSCLNEVVTAAHIKRLVELTLDKFTLPEELTPQMDKHRLAARGVTRELKKTFVGKVRCMLLLPDPSVEHVIAASIQKHTTKVLMERQKTFCMRLCGCFVS